MPPGNFTTEQAASIVAYLRSLAADAAKNSAPPGDAARGKLVFEGKGACTSCHRAHGVGSRVAPDLSEIGSLRRSAEIEKSILDPDAEVTEDHQSVRAVMKDGGDGTVAELGHLYGRADRQQGTIARPTEVVAQGVHDFEELDDAELQRKAQPAGVVGRSGALGLSGCVPVTPRRCNCRRERPMLSWGLPLRWTGFTPGSFGSSLMAYVIAEPCVGVKDTACVDACPVDCIHPKKDSEKFEAETMLYIDPVECIDCGACVPVCPVSAIFALDDLPAKWSDYAQKNATFFGR